MRLGLLVALVPAALSLAFSPLLAPQQPPISAVPTGASAPVVQISNGPGSAFHFTKDDLKLLAESNAIDSALE